MGPVRRCDSEHTAVAAAQPVEQREKHRHAAGLLGAHPRVGALWTVGIELVEEEYARHGLPARAAGKAREALRPSKSATQLRPALLGAVTEIILGGTSVVVDATSAAGGHAAKGNEWYTKRGGCLTYNVGLARAAARGTRSTCVP